MRLIPFPAHSGVPALSRKVSVLPSLTTSRAMTYSLPRMVTLEPVTSTESPFAKEKCLLAMNCEGPNMTSCAPSGVFTVRCVPIIWPRAPSVTASISPAGISRLMRTRLLPWQVASGPLIPLRSFPIGFNPGRMFRSGLIALGRAPNCPRMRTQSLHFGRPGRISNVPDGSNEQSKSGIRQRKTTQARPVSSSSSRANSGTCFRTSGLQAMADLVSGSRTF